ncbi:hypothetical protein [Sinorhizobium sp. BG8]|uniref:hypothetical protein n=1 Tax=Sinorhizobium sp. BG8 TaxID=2613773 RepID=UPI00193E41AC|nr:hypothetical protein [Sinorhizobium sp. BG8]QRM57358.1 hypothetical protein F3Y30_22935 [Sinorhizobium sp. BG8]
MDQLSFERIAFNYRLSPDNLRRHPKFTEVRNRMVEGILAVYAGDHLTNRLLLEQGRHMSFLTVLCLHAAQDPNTPSTWLTLGKLQREITEHGFASRNRVEAQVSALKKYGLLAQQPQAADRRIRLLQPTAKMLARDASVVRLQLAALAELEGDPSAFNSVLSPDFHRAIRRASVERLQDIDMLMHSHSKLSAFFDHDCGYLILLILLSNAAKNGGMRANTCFQRLATQTGVSRTHVRRLLEAVRDKGLLSFSGRGGHDIQLTPAMWDVADQWFAEELAMVELIAGEARAERAGGKIAA